MNIAYSSSEYYFKPTYVSIYSLLINSKEVHEVILLSSDICDKSKNKLRGMVEGLGSSLLIFEVDELLEYYAEKLMLPKMRGNYSTYARIFLAEILPEINEVLLIDSDSVIIEDISSISKNNNNFVMLACRDYVISNKFSRHEDSELNCREYYNMGVLYINLFSWRENNLSEKILSLYDKKLIPRIADQTILNRYLHDYIEPLSIEFNYYTYFHYGFCYAFYKNYNNGTKFISENELKLAKSRPVVLHFIGAWYERPWFKFNISSYSGVYLKYWTKCFDVSELYDRPKLPLVNFIYDFTSISIYSIFGSKSYYFFRYKIIQIIKNLIEKLRWEKL